MALNLDPVFAGNSPFFWIPRSYFAGASQAMVGPGQMPVKKIAYQRIGNVPPANGEMN
jgi:hypothetical protein